MIVEDKFPNILYYKKHFDFIKNKSVQYYSLPLTQKEFEELSRDEILKKRIEYLKENNFAII